MKKNESNQNLLKTIKSYNTKDDKITLNQTNLKIKKSFFNKNFTLNNEDNYISTNSPLITNNTKFSNNSLTSFSKLFKPLKKISHSRTRKKIIPFFSISYSKKIKGEITPILIKEYHKKFPDLRNNFNINNFYLENQRIFDTLLNKKLKNNIKCISKMERPKSRNNRGIIFDKKIIYSYNAKNKEINFPCSGP